MAWLQKCGAVWWLGWRHEGRQYRRSTGETSRERAEAPMGQVEALEVARKARSLTGDYCAMVTGRKLERVRLGEFLLRWQNDAAGQVKPPALVKYQQIVREFLAATRAQETGLLLEDVTAEHISHFFEQKRAKASVTKAYV